VGLRWFRALLVAACLALVWWAVWLLDPRNLAGPVPLAAVLAGQAADLFAVLGFWHTVWPRRPRDLPWGPAAGRAAVLVIAGGRPLEAVEETLAAARALRRRHGLYLLDPERRRDLRWLPDWYSAERLGGGPQDLGRLAGGRFLAVFEAGQHPPPDFMERLLPCFADRYLALIQAARGGGRGGAHVREAILRAEDALNMAPCLGDGCVLRRGALRSIGGLRAAGLSPGGALWLAPALRAHGWRVRYVGEPLVQSRGRSRLADLAGSWRTTVAELGFAIRPGPQDLQSSGDARLHTAWTGLRHLALPGLLISSAGVAASAALGKASPAWLASLAVHLLPYLALRLAVPVLLPEPRLPEHVPVPPAGRPSAPGAGPSEHVPPEMGWNVPAERRRRARAPGAQAGR